jgi:hypothetical protein
MISQVTSFSRMIILYGDSRRILYRRMEVEWQNLNVKYLAGNTAVREKIFFPPLASTSEHKADFSVS